MDKTLYDKRIKRLSNLLIKRHGNCALDLLDDIIYLVGCYELNPTKCFDCHTVIPAKDLHKTDCGVGELSYYMFCNKCYRVRGWG